MSRKTKTSYGFKPDKKNPEDYRFGAFLPTETLQENADWSDYLPVKEVQNINLIETQACTSFATLNCLETLIRRQYNEEINFSDRWSAWNSGTDPYGGNTPNQVAETLRKAGVPLQDKWDFKDIDSPEEFYENPPAKLFEQARADFIEPYAFKHEWVDTDKESIKQALKCSPLGVSVYAWLANGEVYYKPKGTRDNHWTVLYGFDDEMGAWKIYDSYDNEFKLYSYGADIEFAKRYYIKKKETKKQCRLTKYLMEIID